jgi:hypothetical protein
MLLMGRYGAFRTSRAVDRFVVPRTWRFLKVLQVPVDAG